MLNNATSCTALESQVQFSSFLHCPELEQASTLLLARASTTFHDTLMMFCTRPRALPSKNNVVSLFVFSIQYAFSHAIHKQYYRLISSVLDSTNWKDMQTASVLIVFAVII